MGTFGWKLKCERRAQYAWAYNEGRELVGDTGSNEFLSSRRTGECFGDEMPIIGDSAVIGREMFGGGTLKITRVTGVV